jgi:hypothetical protein
VIDPLAHLASKTPKEDLAALRALVESDGWRILVASIEKGAMEAATALANPQLQFDNSIQFQRGALWAALRFKDLPTQRIQALENEVAIQATMTQKPLSKDS